MNTNLFPEQSWSPDTSHAIPYRRLPTRSCPRCHSWVYSKHDPCLFHVLHILCKRQNLWLLNKSLQFYMGMSNQYSVNKCHSPLQKNKFNPVKVCILEYYCRLLITLTWCKTTIQLVFLQNLLGISPGLHDQDEILAEQYKENKTHIPINCWSQWLLPQL